MTPKIKLNISRQNRLRFDGAGYTNIINLTPADNASLRDLNKYVTAFRCVPKEKRLTIIMNDGSSAAHIAARWPLANGKAPAWKKLSFGKLGKYMYVYYNDEAGVYNAYTIMDAMRKQASKFSGYLAYSVTNVKGDEHVETSSYQGYKTAVVYTAPYNKEKAEEHDQRTRQNEENADLQNQQAQHENNTLNLQLQNNELASALKESKTTKWALYIGAGLAVVLLSVLIVKNLKKK